MGSKAKADVISASTNATGDLYSQVTAGMVAFNRQVEVMRANLPQTNMSMQDFEKTVREIKDNVAKVDLINLTKFVQDANFKAYLDSLPKRERDLALFNKRLADNAAMIAQMKIDNGGKKDAELDKLGADNAKAITQDYANATKPAWAQLLDDWQDTTTAMDQMWTNSMQHFADTLTEAITTGKASFKDLATSILKEITRILVSKAIAQLAEVIINMFGTTTASSGGGGGMGSTTSGWSGPRDAKGSAYMQNGFGLHRFAKGGAFTNQVHKSPTLAPMTMFGEAGPEAIMPLTRDSSGRLGVIAQGGGGGVNNQVNIAVTINQDGSADSSAQSKTEQGRQLGGLLDSRIKETLVQESRPGGILWQMKNGR
jgi:phage-related minor tail protein